MGFVIFFGIVGIVTTGILVVEIIDPIFRKRIRSMQDARPIVI